MKLHLLLFSLVFFIFNLPDLSAIDNDIVIENPEFDLATTKRFKISKIELNSTETKIHLQWNIPEGWWVIYGHDAFIRNPETGETQTIISIENEEFDTKIVMDSTGTHHSVFIFPPLKKGIEKIDYNNQFYGLYLNGEKSEKATETPQKISQWIDAELDKNIKKPIQNYEEDTFFSREPAKIIGYIKGYDPKIGFDTGIYYASNVLTREDYPVTIEIDPDGKFQAEIPLVHPVRSYLIFNDRIMFFYLEPGQTLGMILDWEDFLDAEHFNDRFYPQNTIAFKGNLAQINEDLSQFEFPQFNYDAFKAKSLNLSADDFKDYAFTIEAENKEKLDSFLLSHTISSNAELILRNENKLSATVMVMNYLMNREYNQKENPDNKFLQEKIETTYYSFLQNLPLDTKALLINNQFSEFINRFEYADPLNFSVNYNNFKPEISQLEYYDLKKIPLTEEERDLLKEKSFETQEEIDAYMKEIGAFYKKYANENEAYRSKYITPYIAKPVPIDFMEPWHKKDSVLTNALHLKNDLVYDITKTRSLKFGVDMIPDDDQAYKYWDELSASIENDFLKAEGKRIIQNKFPKIKETIDGKGNPNRIKSEIIALPDGKAKNQFYDIADKYKGKIVFVDFWATTCGPCVGSIERMKEIREKYENNPDFEFVLSQMNPNRL